MLLLLILLCLACVALVGWGFTGPNRCLRFPSLFGASAAGFLVPQVIGAFNSDRMHNLDGGLEMFVIMALLCMLAVVAGDLLGYRKPGGRLYRLADYDWRRITEAALILNIVAILAGFFSQVVFAEEIAKRTTLVGGMSGPMVIVIFFATVQRYGFALALILYWRRRSILSLAMVLFGTLNYLITIFFMSRRGPAIEFVFIVMLTYALARGKRIPALLVALFFLVGTFWSTAINDLRTHDGRSTWEKVESADYVKAVQDVLDQGGLEVENGCQVIHTTYSTGEYEWGMLHWNKLVHAYFPGQVFGHDLKEDLKFKLEDIADEANHRRGTVGATATGMADCFTSFGFFGCVKFALIGYFMGRWYRRAFQGDLSSQLAYSALMSDALHTISHGTYWLLNGYIHLAIFSYPVLYWARKPARDIIAMRWRRPALRGVEPVHGVAPGLR
jgi:oligosaccharide repeat unit polymerase